MNLQLARGDALISAASSTPRVHHEHDFSVELTDTGSVVVRSRGGAVFLSANPVTRECNVDVLNFPYIDVAKRKAELEKKNVAKEGKK